ncbi:MAG: iron-containing alcohol dehydrogenase [Clostridiales Family XIII bacterium]|jgi:alcohol dehydrogenase|nr:iron-containing alcohol dehydrogenase [Clostridiales Family XIII bacterium]
MKDFVFKMPTRVLFGAGKAKEIGALLAERGYAKAFLLTDENVGKLPMFAALEEDIRAAGIGCVACDKAEIDPSIESVDALAPVVRESGADVLIALGGGSPIDFAKAICMLQTHEGSVRDYLFGGSKAVTGPGMPLIAIPTTAGTGSEVSAASVITDNERGLKLSVTSDYLIPSLAVIDPALHVGMPAFVTATTGLDALTHAIESYVSLNAEPISDALGLAAIRMIGENLRLAVADGGNMEARTNMAAASLMAGAAFVNGGLGVVHGIAQSMGALHHVAHGVANGLILPYAMERNFVGNLKKFSDIAAALGEDVTGMTLREAAAMAAEAVFDLVQDIGVPSTLPEVGIGKADFPPIIEGTMAYRLLAINPCKLTAKDVERILDRAFEGRYRV